MKLYEMNKHQFGTYDDIIDTPNLLEAKDIYPVPLPKAIRNYRMKEWEAFQIISKRFFIIGAVYNAKFMGISQCVIYDKLRHRTFDFHKNTTGFAQDVANGLDNTVSKYISPDHRIVIHNDIENHYFAIDARHNDFYLLGDGRFDTQPLSIYHPFNATQGVYSTKLAMPFDGRMSLKGHSYDLEDAIIIMDDHKGYYPRHMNYQWATGAGYINDNLCAFNFTANQVLNPEKYNENAVWYGTNLSHFGPVTIENYGTVWNIEDAEHRVHLTFHELADYQIHRNFLAFKVDYLAPIGYFEGVLKLDDGEVIGIDRMTGMTESIDNLI